MIETILPAGASWAEAFDDHPGGKLYVEEEALVRDAVGKRRRDFTIGRVCARAALFKLDAAPAPVLRGEGGAPEWPAGVVGSITHCVGYVAATTGRTTELASLGIDAEPDHPLPDGVVDIVALPDEVNQLAALPRTAGRPAWDRLLFCAKEAVYKAWFPLTGRWLGFEQAAITIDPATGAFVARLVGTAASVDGHEVSSFAGRWLARDGLLAAAVAVSARQP